MGILDDVIAVSNGPNVVNEQHDMGKIQTSDADVRDGIRSVILWDEYEMGISKAEVDKRIAAADTPELRQSIYADLRKRAKRRAGLVTRNGHISVYTYRDIPWHGLGTTLDGIVTWRQACKAAELHDWDLQKIPAYIDFQDRRIESGTFAIVRGDTGDVVGKSVGGRYTIVSNEEAFQFMDSLVESGQTIFESAGALHNGSEVWVQTRRPERFAIGGDEMTSYNLFSNRHDGTGSIWIHPTTVRAVCQNTHRLASQDRREGLSLRHTGDIRHKLNRVRDRLGLIEKRRQDFVEKAESLVSKQLDPTEYFNAVFDDVLDVTIAGQDLNKASIDDKSVLNSILDIADVEKQTTERRRYDRAIRRRKKLFDDVMERYESERNNGNRAIAGSAWAAYNAVSEQADHGRNYKGSSRERAENRMVSTISGAADAVKQTAFQMALNA